MRSLLKKILIVNPKYNIFYFTFCFGIYYIIGYLYIIHNPLLTKAVKFSETYFSPIISIIPRFQKMFYYLSSVQHSDAIGVVSLAIITMIVLVLFTFVQIFFFKRETYEVGHGTFFKIIERIGWKKYIIISILFAALYSVYLFIYLPHHNIFPYLQNKDIINSPFVLMFETASHHFVLCFLGFLLYVVPFIYMPYRNKN